MVIKILTDTKPDKYVEPSGLITFVFVFIGILTLLPQIGMAIARIVENGGLGFNKTEDFICVGWTIAILYQILPHRARSPVLCEDQTLATCVD